MAGGILNLVAYGNQNIMLTGNPTKTMFKTTYAKHTNFGLQKFRLDYNGSRNLSMNQTTTFDFKVPRYGDLLMDTFFVVTLPHIWSPVVKINGSLRPYEFKWIKDIGTRMIEKVSFTVGGQIIQEFTGEYLYTLVEREFSEEKKQLYYKMTGNIPELNDPKNSDLNIDNTNTRRYPNVIYTSKDEDDPDASIYSRKLYVPLNIWFTLAAKMAFPLISLQYNELYISIEIKALQDLYVVRDVERAGDYAIYKKPVSTNALYEFYRFLQPPKGNFILSNNIIQNEEKVFPDKRETWNNDIHLISTYAFLTEEENKTFAMREQSYLVKQVYTHKINNIVGPTKQKIDTQGMVSNWTWYFQRDDIDKRNEWSNFTNWDYENSTTYVDVLGNPNQIHKRITQDSSSLYKTTEYNSVRQKEIMKSCGIVLDGKYRENILDKGVYNYIEKYTRTNGSCKEGIYVYNFGLSSNPFDFQPHGGINLSKFNLIEFEMDITIPPLDITATSTIKCDVDGNLVIEKSPHMNHEYSYTMTIHEERYNILQFISGNAGLMYSR